MACRRQPLLGERPDAKSLTADMVGIGMSFAATPNPDAKLEEPLVHAPVAEVAKRAGCSFATAWQVVRDLSLLHPGEETVAT